MRQMICGFLLIIQFSYVNANINFIKTEKIPDFTKNEQFFAFVYNYQNYYDHWTPEWKYDVKKSFLIDSLEKSFKAFDKLTNKNAETHLLLGVISHYLYNLDGQTYYDPTVLNYTTAIMLDSLDFRGHWFLGFHYTLTGKAEESVHEIFTAQQMLPENVPIAFWEDYIQTTHLAGMPSHSLMGMSVVKNGTGEPSFMEKQIGESIRNRFLPASRDSAYRYNKIWTSETKDMITFTSRVLGISFAIDSTWGISLYDYKKKQAAIMLKPPGIRNSKGRLITYSILIIVRSADDNSTIESFVDPLIKSYRSKEVFKFSEQIPIDLAYDIHEPNMYQDIGGGHFNLVGFHRKEPEIPGLDLETPISPQSSNNNGGPTYLTFKPFLSRLEGPIQYAFLLDTCGDIYEESHDVFKNFLINQLILE